jgi:hypothetical protein
MGRIANRLPWRGPKWCPADTLVRKLQRFFDLLEPGGRLLNYHRGTGSVGGGIAAT